MCIGGTPYVCSHIILLSTPTVAGVTKIAHRERVPNGAFPKLGRVLIPLWERTTPPPKKRRLSWRCASLFHQLLCHHENMLLPWVVLLWQTLYCKELLAKQDIIAHWYCWTRLLIKIFHRCSHSVWLTLLVKISLFFIKLFYKAGCHIYVPEIFLCTWIHTVIVAHRLHLCSCSHTVHGHILFGHDCWARCHEDTPCAWSHIIAVDHTHVLQLRDVIGHITLEKWFNLKHCPFTKWHHWCHRPKQC